MMQWKSMTISFSIDTFKLQAIVRIQKSFGCGPGRRFPHNLDYAAVESMAYL
jgi:hypothetical protein